MLLGADLPRIIEISTQIEELDGPENRIDASELITAEPVALCLLARSLNKLQRFGYEARIEGVNPVVADYLARMDVIQEWLTRSTDPNQLDFCQPHPPIQARRVANIDEANAVANA